MSDWQNFSLIYSVLLLVLVGSAFISYRLPLKQTMKMVLVWIFIFAFGFALVYGLENVFIADDASVQIDEGSDQFDEQLNDDYVYLTIKRKYNLT
jgi:aspartyl protease family protein